jgi:hypothetical protein
MKLNLNPKSQLAFSHPVQSSRTPSPVKSRTPSPDEAPITDNQKKWVDNKIKAMKEKDSYRAGMIK